MTTIDMEGHYEVVKQAIFPDGTIGNRDQYHVTVRPKFGRPFTVWVMPHLGPRGGLLWKTCRTPDSESWYHIHRQFEKAVASANHRARRYLKDHSKPFGIQLRGGSE